MICPACGSGELPMLLGTLGHTTHVRCRCCGTQFSYQEEER